jgi:hypothetical protein
MAESDKESELRDELKSGRQTTTFGCLFALSGFLIPIVMFSIPSIFPCNGECGIGWAGVGFAMVGTPLMVIMGIAIAIIGLGRASKAKRELGLDSERPKHLDW